MRVLVTGHLGYIGPAVVSTLQAAGHEVIGLDSGLFEDVLLEPAPRVATISADVRDVAASDLCEIDAVVHLAGLSNDPLGVLDEHLTHEINVEGTLRLARLARETGVRRFLFSSSCSVYGAADSWVDDSTPPGPLTAYAKSKVEAERGLNDLADDSFCVASLRNSTAFGYSPRLRTDLVVNDLVAGAYLRGEIRLNSDGSAWRPLVHIRDIAQAFCLALDVPHERLNRQAFNVGAENQNYTVLEIARTVAELVPGARLIVPEGANADRRSYRVRFGRLAELLPTFRCQYDLQAGVRDLEAAFRRVGLQTTEPFVRLRHVEGLRASGRLDDTLRFRSPVMEVR